VRLIDETTRPTHCDLNLVCRATHDQLDSLDEEAFHALAVRRPGHSVRTRVWTTEDALDRGVPLGLFGVTVDAYESGAEKNPGTWSPG
jgi:hypothetical protein